jgi:hypothetical protein
LTAALFLYNALAAARSRRIEWRGVTYELKSATETAIIEATPPPATLDEAPLTSDSRHAQ